MVLVEEEAQGAEDDDSEGGDDDAVLVYVCLISFGSFCCSAIEVIGVVVGDGMRRRLRIFLPVVAARCCDPVMARLWCS